MQLQTILNRVTNYKPFVFGRSSWGGDDDQVTVRVEMKSRKNGKPICSGCGQRRPGYDRLPQRTWSFVPLWNFAVILVYALRRVNCPECGVVVERVPWGDGKCQQTPEYRLFLARWARRLSWQEVANIFHTSWDSVYRAVKQVVFWGLVHRDDTGVEAIGIDEIQYQRGHKYLTLVYQIDEHCRRLLWIGYERKEETLQKFFDLYGSAILPTLKYVCSDMWKGYVNVIRERAGDAVHILDRYHIMARMNKAIDEVRAGEARRMKEDGHDPILKHSRCCLLKNPANLTVNQVLKLKDLLKYNLAAVRAYLLREDFQRFWQYTSSTWAGKFLDEWIRRTMRSRLEPMKREARMLRNHRQLLLNWFHAKGQISAGMVEGFNNKAKLTMRKSYGFRTDDGIQIALYHNLAALPEPELTHEFC
jgi:transposase